MKNTWVESIEIKDVHERMAEQTNLLQDLYDSDWNEFEKIIRSICKVTIDEFWREEAFEEEDYRNHMMYWKPVLEKHIPTQVLSSLNTTIRPSFNCVVGHILDQIQFYHTFYLGLWTGEGDYACSCPMCWGCLTSK